MRRSGSGNDGDADPGRRDEPVTVPIEDSIDLHRFQPGEVLEVVDAYLDAAQELGLREVRLIHGRGRGIQRARVQSFLDRDLRVEAWRDAPPGRGGWGATVAWLRTLTPPGDSSDH